MGEYSRSESKAGHATFYDLKKFSDSGREKFGITGKSLEKAVEEEETIELDRLTFAELPWRKLERIVEDGWDIGDRVLRCKVSYKGQDFLMNASSLSPEGFQTVMADLSNYSDEWPNLRVTPIFHLTLEEKDRKRIELLITVKDSRERGDRVEHDADYQIEMCVMRRVYFEGGKGNYPPQVRDRFAAKPVPIDEKGVFKSTGGQWLEQLILYMQDYARQIPGKRFLDVATRDAPDPMNRVKLPHDVWLKIFQPTFEKFGYARQSDETWIKLYGE